MQLQLVQGVFLPTDTWDSYTGQQGGKKQQQQQQLTQCLQSLHCLGMKSPEDSGTFFLKPVSRKSNSLVDPFKNKQFQLSTEAFHLPLGLS